jgi:hypothetical protein
MTTRVERTATTRRMVPIATLILVAAPAFANAGVPMIAVLWPLLWLALLPIIATEAAILARLLGRPLRPLLWPTAKANLASTLVGVPVAWLAMIALQSLFNSAEHLGVFQIDYTDPANLYWTVPFNAAWLGWPDPWAMFFAAAVLSVPFCAISIVVERLALGWTLFDIDASRLKRTVRIANIVTYLAFLLALLANTLLT